MSQSGETSQQSVIITLVHGTWGRGFFARDPRRVQESRAFWFDPRSRFFRELSARLVDNQISFELRSFLWSGANSFYARSEAARRLAVDLKQNQQQKPDAKQFVIGHSHGGTVAMLAAKDLKEANQPDLITLATPFVELGTEIPSQRLQSSTVTLIGLIAFYLTVLASCTLLPFDVPNWVFGTFCVITFAAFALLIAYASIGIAPLAPDRLSKLMEGAWGGLSNVRRLKILTLRGVDDEATLTLAAGAIATRMVGSIYHSIALSSVIIIPLCAGYGPTYLFPPLPGLSEQQNQVFATFLPVPTIALICLMLPGLFRTVYGRELGFGTLFMQVKSHSSPDSDDLTAITLTSRNYELFGFRHGIYNHPDVCETIAGWISTQLTVMHVERNLPS